MAARTSKRSTAWLLPGTVLLLSIAAFFSYWSYLQNSVAGPSKDWLEKLQHVDLDPANTTINDNVLEDQQGLRSLLSPEKHIHRAAQTIQLQWNVTFDEASPDGVRRKIYKINGQFPGPTIEARSGDTLEITVTNSVSNGQGVSIHWHGLFMQDANHMDGVVGLTQCAIPVGRSFVYRFRIADTQHGTFWYHAHAGVQQADGLYGGVVVHQPDSTAKREAQIAVPEYDAEQLLLIGDWYHKPGQAVLDRFKDFTFFGNDPAPDSMVINGRGYFECSMATAASPVDCDPVAKPQFTLHGERVRLRVVNVGALTGITIAIPKARMSVFEIDGGGPIETTTPAESVGILYPGERMDMVVDREAGSQADTIIVALDRENLKFKNFALTPTQTFPLVWNGKSSIKRHNQGRESEDAVSHTDLSHVVGVPPETIPAQVDHKAVIYTKIEILASQGNSPLGVINRTSWIVDEDPKTRPLLALERKDWPSMRDNTVNQPMGTILRDIPWYHTIGDNVWMDLVINNIDDMGHPFHLHGFSFYVVASWRSPSGYQVYNPFDASVPPPGGEIMPTSARRKDTVYVPRMGYVVLRFRANNAGLWLLHCHTLWHHAAGMGMVLQMGAEASVDKKQKASELCV